MAEHEIAVDPVTVGHGRIMYVATCSCSKYRSSKCNTERQAEKAGYHHVNAKQPGAKQPGGTDGAV